MMKLMINLLILFLKIQIENDDEFDVADHVEFIVDT